MSTAPDNRTRLWLAALALVHAAVLGVFAATGRPNIDEGMFWLAGQAVAEGRLPYRDFPFAQAPLLPYALAAAPVWQGSPILGGRVLAVASGTLGMLGALWLAQRLAGLRAATLLLGLSLATLPGLWVAATVRAQSFATPLLVLGVAALALRAPLGWRAGLSLSLLLASTALRLTNAGVLVAVALWTAWRLRGAPGRLAGLAAALAVLALGVALPVVRAPEQAWFQLIGAQLSRAGRFGYVSSQGFPGDTLRLLGAYLDLLPDAALLVALAIPLAAARLARIARGWRPALAEPLRDSDTAPLALGALGALAFAPQLRLENAFLEYLIPFWALLAPAVAIGVARACAGRPAALGRSVVLAVFGLAALNAAAAHDVWIGRGAASFASFQRAGRELGARAGAECTILSLETELVAEAGCRVLPGLEYSYFAYFADMPSELARRRGVANLALLRERVEALQPELVVLAPGHPHLLLGPEQSGARGARRPGSVEPLAFLGPLARHYELYERRWVASGIRRAGERDGVPLLVYRRSGAW